MNTDVRKKKIFVSVSPGFYKKNLFSELYKQIDIKVIYTTSYDESSRNKDFMQGDLSYPYVKLTGSTLKQLWKVIKIVCKQDFDEFIVGDYNSLCSWIHIFLSPKKKNSVIVESTFRETKTSGIRVWLKKFFFSRVSKAYVCGSPHAKLTRMFGFKGENIVWHSVGLFNCLPQPQFEYRNEVKKFLFVGRLIPEKNLKWLIRQFEKHEELELNIVGFGILENELKQRIKTKNIKLLGAVNNKDLPYYYREADVFILPSITETWGLVVEEALNNGTPVMTSHMVGCADDLVIPGKTGIVFELDNEEDFNKKLNFVLDINNYNVMRKHISTLNFFEREKEVVKAFVNS